jgi:antitoxin ParD1/3/4
LINYLNCNEVTGIRIATLASASLPPDLEQFVQTQLAAGKYASASEVVCDAVRLMREREIRVAALRRDIDAGIRQLESGDYIEINSDAELEAFFKNMAARIEEKSASKQSE